MQIPLYLLTCIGLAVAKDTINIHRASVHKSLIISNERVIYDVKSMKSLKCLGQQNLTEKWRKEVDMLVSFTGEEFSLTKFLPTYDSAMFDYVEPTNYTFSRKLKEEVLEGPYAILNYNNNNNNNNIIIIINNKTTEYRLVEQHSNRNSNGFKKLDVYMLFDITEKEALRTKGGIMIIRMHSPHSHASCSYSVGSNDNQDNVFNMNRNQDNFITSTAPPLFHNYPIPLQTIPSPDSFINERVAVQLTPDIMADYLIRRAEYDSVLTIFHSKVAQKSCGNEKRYFCPPPCVYLSGGGWKKKQQIINKNQQYRRNYEVGTSNEANKDLSTELFIYIGISQNEQDRQQLDFSGEKDFCTAKMFVNNADKRKFVEISAQLFYGCGMDVGHFYSNRIKIISKPSKKKTNVKPTDSKYICIANGTKVSLFNRTKSQDQRYLHVENNSFHASATKWGAFTIYLVDDSVDASLPSDTSIFSTKDGYIYYGSVIKLVDSVSNISLPKLIVRKVDNQQVILFPSSQDEPVSQLHKCAFEIVGQPMHYLALNNDKIIMHRASEVDEFHHRINDGAGWTIISVDTIEYRFFESLGPVPRSITPIPIVSSLEITGAESFARITIYGINLLTNLQIWFATTPVETVWRSNESIMCMIPPFSTINRMFVNEELEVPICLVRNDGVIFPTKLTFSYKNMQIQ